MSELTMQQVIDKQAIADALARYARGVDRINADWIKSAFWPEATDDHGTFTGNAHEFADYLMTSLRRFESSMHAISNLHVELDGDRARVESYINGYHGVNIDGKSTAIKIGGRYLDRFEKRSGEWRILARVFVMDWLEIPPQAEALRPHFSKVTTRGAPSPNDPWDLGAPVLPG